MIISHALQYVYIGIPRTSSTSMNRWLMDHFEGEWFGGHHDWQVPEEARNYLIFTMVRNPYERRISFHFNIAWNDEKDKSLREYVAPPQPSSEPLEERIQQAILRRGGLRKEGKTIDHGNQKHFIDKAGVSLALYFERRPACLRELPFVDEGAMPPFPHSPQRGIRPPGNFFDYFAEEDEEVEWAYAGEDFEAFGYRRYDCGLPAEAPNALYIN